MEPPGLQPAARMGHAWCDENEECLVASVLMCLADRVKFVESVDTRSAGHTVPVVAASFSPAVDPGLAY